MPDNLYPYTVAAVVDTDTGELVGTPIVRTGHADHARFDTVKPLGATEQFRLVHVWAPDEASAAATGVLTADQRAGAGRTQPRAGTSTGAPGHRPFTVAFAVDPRTGRLVGEPVAAEGSHALSDARFIGPAGIHVQITNLWARDRANAIAQVTGTSPRSYRSREQRTAGRARGDPHEQTQALTPDAAAAQREWTRLAGMPISARAALIADTLWSRAYRAAYRTAYTTTASQVAAAATEASERNDGAWLTLHHLAAAAGGAISQLTPQQPIAPPAHQRTVAAVATAIATASTLGHEPSWQRMADVVAAGSHTAATLAGTVTAATDVLIGWRARFGHEIAEGVTIDGQPARAWIGNLLATANRDSVARVESPPAAGRTAAQLARQHQATVKSSTALGVATGVASSKTRSAASPASARTTTRRSR